MIKEAFLGLFSRGKGARPRSAAAATPPAPDAATETGFEEAQALFREGNFAAAEEICRKILQLDPDHSGALHLRGAAEIRGGRYGEAVELLAGAVSINPAVPDYHKALGDAFRQLGRIDKAIESYREAVRLNPDYADARNNLGVALAMSGNPEAAIESYRAVLRLDPEFAEAHVNLGNALQQQGLLEASVECYREALRVRPDYALAYNNLGLALRDLGQVEAARTCDERLMQLAPSDGTRIRLATTLPVVSMSRQEILRMRTNFKNNVCAILEQGATLADPLAEVGQANFYLAYHGMNDREPQVLVARLYEQACPALRYVAPHCRQARRPSAATLRVGFLSKFFFNHSVGTWFSRLIDLLAAEGPFEVVLLTVGHVAEDTVRRTFSSGLEHVSVPERLDSARKMVGDLQLDILVYADIGMEPVGYFLAFSRLAPVQCAMLGHPVTTGIPNVDYFISSALFEPENARNHYSESLLLLNSLPVYMAKPAIPVALKGRGALGLPEDRVLYVCPMMLHKLHPDFDEAMAQILRRDPRGEIVLFRDGRHPARHEFLMERFSRTMPDVLDRVRFLPWLSTDDLMSVFMAADVVLDSYHFGAGTTAFMVLATGNPIVTLPSEFVRGRPAYGCYRKMGIMDCVAGSPQEYVELAIRVGADADFRAAVRQRILENNWKLFEDRAVVREMAGALQRIAGRESPGTGDTK